MRLVSAIATTVFVTYLAVVSLLWCLTGFVNHDEHQFMASAFMVAQFGLHPYQDFAYFHMPNLVYLYAPCFLTSYPFMLARIFVGICGFGICLVIFLCARSIVSGYDRIIWLIFPICITAFLVHSPLFRYASSHVWNHTPSTLCAVVSFLLHCHAIRCNRRQFIMFFLSGVSLGMAIGIRLSFAPLIIPFFFSIAVFPTSTFRKKGILGLSFIFGVLIANTAAVYFFLTSYSDFLFGNLGYAKLNTIYRQEMSYSIAMTLVGKIRYLKWSVLHHPSELLIVVATFYIVVVFIIGRMRKKERPRYEIILLFASLPFLSVGVLAPTPSWHQYYFALIPFFILLIIYTVSSLENKVILEAMLPFFVIAAFISFVYGSPITVIREVYTKPQLLTPIQIQRETEEIKRYVNSKIGKKKILTLSPLYAVASHLPIYKEFVTGPFAWRVSHLLSEEEAVKRAMLRRSQIKSFIKKRRPVAILTGKENKELETPIMQAAHEQGYQPKKTSSGIIVWLSPIVSFLDDK